jgi:parvulin-like peptidyl-prolyl isomerase
VPGGDPEAQAAATQEQWDAALARADAWHTEVQDPNADWFELGKESDDPGSRNNGGDLGWYDPTTGQFVPEFEAAVARLAVGDISEPVRTEFGYHVIQVTDQRTTALDYAESLIEDLQADPDSFGAVALANSEDSATRTDEGYFGWVAHYETTATREEAIFGMAEIGEISSRPVVDGNQIWILQLIDQAERRSIDETRLTTIKSTGYTRWYDELKSGGEIWIDTQLQADSTQAV